MEVKGSALLYNQPQSRNLSSLGLPRLVSGCSYPFSPMASSLDLSIHHNSIYYGRLLKNLLGLLQASCRQSFYEVIPKGVQVWLPDQNRGIYPDLCIVAGEPLFHQGYANRVTNPCLVIEILSDVTPAYDPAASILTLRQGLFDPCRSIPYLQEYVFVHQQEIRIEQFHRVQENLWSLTVHHDLTAVAELHLTDTRLPLMEVYDRVDTWLTDKS